MEDIFGTFDWWSLLKPGLKVKVRGRHLVVTVRVGSTPVSLHNDSSTSVCLTSCLYLFPRHTIGYLYNNRANTGNAGAKMTPPAFRPSVGWLDAKAGLGGRLSNAPICFL